jgi:SNF2 family DNA or RNA helicase
MVADLARDELEADHDAKLIIFAYHVEVIALLQRHLAEYDPIAIHGGASPKHVREGVGAFQHDPRRRLIILQIDSAAEAITLTAAHIEIFAEASWTPLRNDQAIARAYRRGQENSVTVRMVTLPGSLDERIGRVLVRKAREIAGIVDGTKANRQNTHHGDAIQFPLGGAK